MTLLPDKRFPCSECLDSLRCVRLGGCQSVCGGVTNASSKIGGLSPKVWKDSLEQALRNTNTQLIFAAYKEDNTLRLFKKGSMLSDETAGYSDEEVVVKVMVKRPSEQFLVCIPIRRDKLDSPGIMEWLGWTAYNHRHGE